MSDTIATAMSAADSALFLDTPADVGRALKAWRRSKVLGLDTEFVRERTYYAELGLVQISDGNTVWLVDPLVKGNLSPLRDLLADRSITKLFHSPSEDLDVFRNTVGELPDPLVDTQTACALLGQPLQLAYHAAVNWLLGIEIAKDQTRSNWLRRPLSRNQLRYAALDVCLLPVMWQRLRKQLEERGRLEWLIEDCSRLTRSARQAAHDEDAWQRFRAAGRLDGTSLAVLRKLAAWREEEARNRNLPRGFVVPDPVLMRIAQQKISSESQLRDLEGLHRKALERYGFRIITLVADVIESGEALPVIKPLDGHEKKSLNLLRAHVSSRASALGVDPALLASRKELESAIRVEPGQWPEKFSGWRRQFLGEQLQQWAA